MTGLCSEHKEKDLHCAICSLTLDEGVKELCPLCYPDPINYLGSAIEGVDIFFNTVKEEYYIDLGGQGHNGDVIVLDFKPSTDPLIDLTDEEIDSIPLEDHYIFHKWADDAEKFSELLYSYLKGIRSYVLLSDKIIADGYDIEDGYMEYYLFNKIGELVEKN